MNSIERSIEHIATKAHLKDWIDALPEGTRVVVLALAPDNPVAAKYCLMNNPTRERCHAMASTFARYILPE